MQSAKTNKAINPIALIFCILLSIILVCNIVIIVMGAVDANRPPALFGYTTTIVMSESMSGQAKDHIESGDLIVTKAVDLSSLKSEDIITYMDNDGFAITHRIIERLDDGRYLTKGDANNVADNPVLPQQVIGKYVFRIPKLGSFIFFMHTPIGMLLFIGLPVVLYIAISSLILVKQAKQKTQENVQHTETENAVTEESENSNSQTDIEKEKICE